MAFMTPGESEASKGNGRYVIMMTGGQGGGPTGYEFDYLHDALQFVYDHEGDGSFGIVYPDGSWHQW